MKTSDITLDIDDISLMVIGEAGTGKTYLVRSMPAPYVFDFDKGVASLRHFDGIEFDLFKESAYGAPAMPKKGIYKFGEAWPAFIEKLNSIGELIDSGNSPFKSLVFDSFSGLTNICMNYIIAKDNHFDTVKKKPKNPEIQQWGDFNNRMRSVLDQLVTWPGIKLVTAHVERATNPLTEAVEMLPLTNAKLQGLAPTFFDEVYYSVVKMETVQGSTEKRQVYKLVAAKQGLYAAARSRWMHNQKEVDNSWEAIRAAILAAGERKNVVRSA